MLKHEKLIILPIFFLRRCILLSFSTLIITSCATRDEIVYFQGIEDLQNYNAPENFQAEIEVNDVLQIDVSSLNEEIVQPFIMTSSSGQGGGGQNSQMQGYLVDIDGNINFPVLGEVSVVGKTREELEEFLTAQLKEYVRDAVVRVRIMNFKITVIGEIGSSVIEVSDERLSIIQAVAMAGDVSYNGKRENVLIVRMKDGKIIHGRVDLTSAQIFKDPFYYLKQNDIVYVEPTYRRVKSTGFITSWQGVVSIITTGFSLFYLFNNI